MPKTQTPVRATFCRRCGQPINADTKRCSGCGKQYFRGVSPLLFLCIVLIVIILLLVAVTIVQHIRFSDTIRDLRNIINTYENAQ